MIRSLARGEVGALLLAAATLSAAAVLLFKDLGLDNVEIDEARAATRTVEMLETGNYLVPTLDGEPDLRKPPLKFWLVGATLALGGESEFWLRFWDAAAGLGTLAIVFFLAHRLGGPLAAVTAVLVLATIPTFLFDHSARTHVHDSLLWFLIAAAATSYAIEPRTMRRAVLAGALAGAAILTKGLAAASLLVILACFELVVTRGRGLFQRRLWISFAVAGGVALCWYLPAALLAGGELSNAIGFEMRKRVGLGAALLPEPSFYARQIAEDFGRWLWFAPAALLSLGGRRGGERWLPFVWAAVALVCYSAARIKHPWYVVPAYPAIAVLIGLGLGALVDAAALAPASVRRAVAGLAVVVCLAPAYLRAYERTGFFRYPKGELRSFAEYVTASVPPEVPILLLHPNDLPFGQHERLYAYWLRHRIQRVTDAEALCREIAAAKHGAFAIVTDQEIPRLPCLGRYQSSLPLRPPIDPNERKRYVPKRVIPVALPSPPFFEAAEARVDLVAGEGLGPGWDATLFSPDPPRRGIDGSRALVVIDVPRLSRTTLYIDDLLAASSRNGCQALIAINGISIGPVLDGAPSAMLSVPENVVVAGRNVIEITRPCPDVAFAARAIALRESAEGLIPTASARGRRDVGAHRHLGSNVRDSLSPTGTALAADVGEKNGGSLFFLPLALEAGRYTARFELRSVDAASAETAAVLDITSDSSGKLLSRRRVTGLEIANATTYVPVDVDFTLPAADDIQLNAHIWGRGEIRLSCVRLIPARAEPIEKLIGCGTMRKAPGKSR